MDVERFAPGDADVFVAGLLGAIDIDGGPTDEQLAVLQAFVTHLWKRPDLDLATVTPLRAAEVADRLPQNEARLRFCEMVMTLELCRHPQSAAQVDRAEEFAAALGVTGIAMETTRTALEQGAAEVAADLERVYGEILPEVSERSLRDRYLKLDAPDPALAARLRALADLPAGSLGHAYLGVLRAQRFRPPRRRRAPAGALRQPRHEPRDHRLRTDRAR